MLVLGLSAAMSQGARNTDFRNPELLMLITEYGEIWNALRDLNNLPESRRLMVVDALVEMLGDNYKLRLDGYVFRDGEPDLRTRAGRAEWFIDQVLPRETELPWLKMNERIEMWKASDASRQTVTPQHVEMLKTKYEGKVPTGIVGGKATESIKNLENFLEEWFPYGKPLQEMEEILGVKLPVKDDEAVLVIDHGLWGQAFRFLLRQGKIRAVKKRGLN
jgi:hypothetical protein